MKQLVRPVCLGILLAVGTTGCDGAGQNREEGPVAKAHRSAAQTQKPGMSSLAPIPSDVTYAIVTTNMIPGIKRSLDVRLSRTVEEDVLRSIAMDLWESDPSQYERTFIVYYLPGMQVGAGGWATTHFNPDLEVHILGLTTKQEKALAAERADTTREVVGNWLDQRPMIAGKISIYRKDGRLYMERNFKDGSGSIKELVEKTSSDGMRYEEKGGSSFGQYYIVDRQGNLQIRDQEGLIATARKLE